MSVVGESHCGCENKGRKEFWVWREWRTVVEAEYDLECSTDWRGGRDRRHHTLQHLARRPRLLSIDIHLEHQLIWTRVYGFYLLFDLLLKVFLNLFYYLWLLTYVFTYNSIKLAEKDSEQWFIVNLIPWKSGHFLLLPLYFLGVKVILTVWI